MNFEISGINRLKGIEKPFKIKVEARNEKLAREKAYSLFGSAYKLKRHLINISEIKEIK